MKLGGVLLALLLVPGLAGAAHAHVIDSVGPYRVEIGWMNEPVVSNETNAVELYISPLEPGLELAEQEFKDGIVGLKKTIRVELAYKTEKITLPLSADHDTPGKYFAFVNPTVAGYYQANVLGTIVDTPISLSMHPPKVEERAYIEFPRPSDYTVTQMVEGHTALIEYVNDLGDDVADLKRDGQRPDVGYVGAGLGLAGLAVAVVAVIRSRK